MLSLYLKFSMRTAKQYQKAKANMVIRRAYKCTQQIRGVWWLSVRASDSGARGRGVRNLPPPFCVLEQDTLPPPPPPRGTGNTKKQWLRPDMTEN